MKVSDTGAPLLPVVTDEFLETHTAWREACEDVRGAYDDWKLAAKEDSDLAFAVYSAALDREERAAHLHAAASARLHALLTDES